MTEVDERLSRLRELSPAKYALLIQARKQRAADNATTSEIAPSRPGTDRPLSFGQQRLWFLDQMAPGNPAYNMPFAIRLRGEFDLAAAQAALTALVARHETLRTTFVVNHGQPSPTVAASMTVPLTVVDLRDQPEAEAEAGRLAAAHANEPFDLTRGPLLRITAVLVGPRATVMLINLHHIVCDDWSMGVLTSEFAAYYRAHRDGTPAELPPMPIQYGDFARWQRERLSAADADARMAHWRDRLAGELPRLDLATDHPRPPVQTFTGATVSADLPPAVAAAARNFGPTAGATLFMTLLAAYVVLLTRHTGQSDLVVGTAVANRDRPETEPLIGFLVNTLALRMRVPERATFREVLALVRQECLTAYAYQDIPFERVVQQVQPERDTSRPALFQTMFTLHNTAPIQLQLPGLSVEPFLSTTARRSALFDISLDVVDLGAVVRCDVEYNTDLFTAPTVERFLRHYLAVLDSALAQPERPVSELPLLSPAERAEALDRANLLAHSDRPRRCIHHLFEDHVRATPDAIAVVDADERLTYAELDRRAEGIAHMLRAAGVGPEVRVAQCGQRAVSSIVGLLGILKAGGVYVPLDPAHPVERLNTAIADSGARIVLTQQAVHEAAPRLGNGIEVRYLDASYPMPDGPYERSDVTPDNLAYVVYTSGSTGRPKGVMVPHHALVSAYQWYVGYYRLTEVRRHLQTANLAFDAFFGDFSRALLGGGTLVLCPRDVMLDPAALYELMQTERVQCAEFVPAVMRLLAGHLRETGRRLDSLKTLIVGSDSWYMREFREYQELCGPDVPVVNAYGVSEATVDSSFYDLQHSDRSGDEQVPIGRPLTNSTMLVLDRNGEPVPVGVVGRIYIGGHALARGYNGRPGLTAERFVPHPFSPEPGDRLYDTGDLGRCLPSADIEFLGRADRQVKVRGFRIELEEVEAVLTDHPAVLTAAVVAAGARADSRHLAAFVVPRPDTSVSEDELRAFMKRRLPGYMVPATYTQLDRIPTTSSGKLDRTALPVDSVSGYVRPTGTLPRTPIEREVAATLMSLLGIDAVYVDDDFFDLGGHSMLVPPLVFQLRERFGAEIAVRTLFETTTVEGIAQLIEGSPRPSVAHKINPWVADTALPADVTVSPARRPATPARAVLVTGVTGFLGAFMLTELLREDIDTAYCLVRATDAADGHRRLAAALTSFGLPGPDRDRVRIVAGDLAQPRFGLSTDEYSALAGRIDAIYHSAAAVNLVQPYQRLRAVNVEGTIEVLRLAGRAGGAAVHHISTISAPNASDPDMSRLGGYNQSKWVAERLGIAARERGIPVAIYRPDYIGGDTTTGVGNPKDLIWAMVKGSIQLGRYPEIDVPVNIVPVDLVSRAIVGLARREPIDQRSFDLGHPRPIGLTQVFAWVRQYGYAVRPLPYEEWQHELAAAAARSSENALYPFLDLLAGSGAGVAPAPQTTPMTVGDAYTLAGVACPPLNCDLLHTYLHSLLAMGYLPSPGGSA